MEAILIIVAIIILVFVIRAVGNSNSDTSSKKSEWMDGRSNEKIIEEC